MIGELERAVLRGDDDSGAELVLAQLRRIARDDRDGTPRVSNIARLFFRPLEPFLVSDREREHPGRIARSSREALWTWVRRDLLREDAKVTIDGALAVASAGDGAARMAETPYAVAVAVVLMDAERQIDELRTELDPPSDGAWARAIAGHRAQIADTLRFEIDNVPDRVRRMLCVRKAADIRPHSTLDPGDVADTEALLKFIGVCRQFAGELATNEITRRTVSALADLLQRGTRALAESLRHAGNEDRAFRQSQLDAAVRFCAQVLEPDLAAELRAVADDAGAQEASEPREESQAPEIPERKAAWA
ncbi:MAG: hypothetical protein P8Z80_03720 [Pseudolabrys sp.]